MERKFNIVSLFVKQAELYPDKVAIIEGGQSVSFGNLLRDVRAAAAHFRYRGIRQGDRVLVFVPMSIALYRTVLALFYMGVTVVFVDEWANRSRLDRCCAMADCTGFVGIWKAHLLRVLSKEIRRIPLKFTTALAHSDVFDMVETSGDDAALITFTTGSTGIPKAAVRTHRFLNEQFLALVEKMDAKSEDIDMSVLPIILLINLAIGSTSVIADFKSSKPAQMNADRLVKQMKKHAVSRLVASPYFVKRIAQSVIAGDITLDALEAVFTGGAPVYQADAGLFTKAFPRQQIEVVYGSTEVEPISSVEAHTLGTEQVSYTPTSGLPIGRAYRKSAVRIIKITEQVLFDIDAREFEAMTCRDGEWGEIIVSGPHVLAHYFKNEEALRRNKILIDGVYWHRTGDAGYKVGDELFLVGRCQTLIPQGSHYLSPFIFENYMQSVAGVEMATILQVSGRILVFVELKGHGADRQEIQRTVRKLPIVVDAVFFRKIPRDPRHHSKIAYEELIQSM